MTLSIKSTIIITSFLFTSMFAQNGLNGLHPGYDRVSIQPPGESFYVAGMDHFSNGDLAVCNWGNPADVWILKNPGTGAAGSHQAKRFAFGLQQVMGCKVVRDTIYVLQMSELTKLVDSDGDGLADEYIKVNDAFVASESLLGYAFDLEYFEGFFYAALASDVGFGGMNVEPEQAGRSQWIKMGPNNFLETIGSGFRNPNGMGIGFGNKFFAVDNQGSWNPSSKINHLQEGNFYGHYMTTGNTFQPTYGTEVGTPPVVWLPQGEVSNNPGDLQFIENGIFKDQFLFAELQKNRNRMYRISMEEVNGVMQGAIHPFSGGFTSGPCRVTIDKDNNIYAGILGASGSWNGYSTMNPGLQRMIPKDINQAYAFEILRARSMGPTQIALDFTMPVQSTGNQTSKYTVETWTNIPAKGYGAGRAQDRHNLNVNSVALSNGNRTATLSIGGLQENYEVKITLNNLQSSTGDAAWGNVTWFTINNFGPGTIPVTPIKHRSKSSELFVPFQIKHTDNQIQVEFKESGTYKMELVSIIGERIWTGNNQGLKYFTLPAKTTKGVYLLRIKIKDKFYLKSIPIL